MQTHFSINAAAEILERDRRTIRRALLQGDTPPDSFERKQPRWKLPTIIAALEANADKPARAPRHNSGVAFATIADDLENDRRTLPVFGEFNQALAEVTAEKTVEKRRAMAGARIPKLLDGCIATYRAACIRSGEFIDGDCRADGMVSHLLDGFEKLCAWTHEEVWEKLLIWDEEE